MTPPQFILLALGLTARLAAGFVVIPGLGSSPRASLVNRAAAAAAAPTALPDQAGESIRGYIDHECDWATGFEGAGKDACVSACDGIFHEDTYLDSLYVERHDHESPCGKCFCTCGPS
ncbi:hypothetical protein NpPPO83_00002067 [Neofusicoccum parvum]|uniref:Uncharacterized protein n=1 Tax=Neofusicoccum parvum TaxID=310453 RepID=A0ACB5SHG9_9PEZI|nr:hypothetical protein NpPPO83_00002067 [Neofusicoccum parvum]